MKTEMMEALRLTRQGRLAEAKALIQRAFGRGHAPEGMRTEVNVQPVQPESASGSEPPKLELPDPGTTETREATPSEPAIPPSISAPPTPSRHFTVPKLKDELGQDLLKKLRAHGPAPRQFPIEMLAPTAGCYVAGVYAGQAGTRAYKLYVPSRYQGQPLPLLVMLHGCTQSADDFAAGTRMNFLAESEGFLVVYPEQAAGANANRCWNWFRPPDQQRDQGEPSLIAGISRQVMMAHQVNASRGYVAGLSAGAAMAAIVAAVYPDLFAAVGVHSGMIRGSAHDLPSALQAMQQGPAQGGSSAAGQTIPLILFQGDQDSTVHPRNAEEFIRVWFCGRGQPQVTSRQGQAPGGRTYTCTIYQDLSSQAIVERWTVHGASHAWAGGSVNGSFTDPAGPDASKELVRFFQEHARGTAVSSAA